MALLWVLCLAWPQCNLPGDALPMLKLLALVEAQVRGIAMDTSFFAMKQLSSHDRIP